MQDNNIKNSNKNTDPKVEAEETVKTQNSQLQQLNPFNNQEAIIKPSFESDLGSISDNYSASVVSAKEYAKYFDEGVSELPGIEKVKAANQRFYSQAFNWAVQSVGEVVGGSLSGLGSIYEGIQYIASEHSRENADFTNMLMNIGKDITDFSKELAPIHRINPNKAFDLTDFGWWAENGVSIASTLSMLVPARAAIGGARWLGKVTKLSDKIGDTTKFLAESAIGAVTMRNAENMRESMDVTSKTEKDMLERLSNMSKEEYEDYLKTDLGKEWVESTKGQGKKEDLAKFIAAKAGWHTYNINSINVVFDFIQTATALKALSGSTRTGIAGSKEVAKQQARVVGEALTKAQRFKLLAAPTVSAFSAQLTEGVEEIINFIGGKEGEAFAKEQQGKDIGDLDERIGKYLDDPHAWNAGFWGVLGGVAFSSVSKFLEREGIAQITNNKIAEIGNRANLMKTALNKLPELDKAFKEEKITTKEYIVEKRNLFNTLGYQMGISAAMAGNMNLLEEHLSNETYKKQLETSLTESQKEGLPSIDFLMTEVLNNARVAETIYNKYNNRTIKAQVSNEAKAKYKALQIDAELNLKSQEKEIAETQKRVDEYMPEFSETSLFKESLQLKSNKIAISILEEALASKDINNLAKDSISRQLAILTNENDILRNTIEATKNTNTLNILLDGINPNKELLDNSVELVLRKVAKAQLQDSILNLADDRKVIEIDNAIKEKNKKEKNTKNKELSKILNDENITIKDLENLKTKIESSDVDSINKINKKIKELEEAEKIAKNIEEKNKKDDKDRLATSLENEQTVTENLNNLEDLANLIGSTKAQQVENSINTLRANIKDKNTLINELKKLAKKAGKRIDKQAEIYILNRIKTLENNKEEKENNKEEKENTEIKIENELGNLLAKLDTNTAQKIILAIETIKDELQDTPQLIEKELKKLAKKAKKRLGEDASIYIEAVADSFNIVENKEIVKPGLIEDSTNINVINDVKVENNENVKSKDSERSIQKNRNKNEKEIKEEVKISPNSKNVTESIIVDNTNYGSANLYVLPFDQGIAETNEGYTANSTAIKFINNIKTLAVGSEVTLEVDKSNKYHKDNEEDAFIVIKFNNNIIGVLNTIKSIEIAIKNEDDLATKKIYQNNLKATSNLRSVVWNNGNIKKVTTKITKLTSGTKIQSDNFIPVDEALVGNFELYYADDQSSSSIALDTLISITGKSYYTRTGNNDYYNSDLEYTLGGFYALVSGLNDNTDFSTKENVQNKVPLKLRVATLNKEYQENLYNLITEVITLMRSNDVDFNKNERLNELRTEISKITAFNKSNSNKDGTVTKPYFKIHKEYIEFLSEGDTKLYRLFFNKNSGSPSVVEYEFDNNKGSYNNWSDFRKKVGNKNITYYFENENSLEARDLLIKALSSKQYQISLDAIRSGELTAEQLIKEKKLLSDAGKLVSFENKAISNFIHKENREGSSNLVISIDSNINKVNEEIDFSKNSLPVKEIDFSKNAIETTSNKDLTDLKNFRKSRKNKTTEDYDAYTMEVLSDNKNKILVSVEERKSNWLKLFGNNIPFDPNIDELIRYKGKLAYGLFSRAAVQLSKFAPTGAEAHEAFHVAMHIYLKESGRLKIYQEARKKYGNLTNRELEELLAEDFREYFLNNKNKKNNFINLVFNRIKAFIENILGKYSINRLFNEINSGYFNYQPDTASLEYAKKIGMTMEVELEDIYGSYNLDQYVNYMVGISNQWLGKHPNVTLQERSENNNLNIRYVIQDHLYNHLDTIIAAAEATNSEKDLATYLQAGKIISSLAEDLDSINSKLWKRVVFEVDRLLNLKIEEEVQFEGNNKLNKNWDDRLAYAKSSKESFDFDLKRLIMSTRAVNSFDLDGTNIKYEFKKDNAALLPTFLNFDYVYNHLASQMTNAKNVEEMMARLKNLGDADASFILLWERINANPLYKAKWFSNFNKTFIEAEHHRVVNDSQNFKITKSVSNKRYTLADNWLSTINALISENNANNFNYFNEDFKLQTSKLILNIRQELRNINFDEDKLADNLSNLAKFIGIELNKEIIKKIGNNKALNVNKTSASVIKELIAIPLIKIIDNFNISIGTNNPIIFESKGRLNALASIVNYFVFDATENSYFGVDGNMRFSLSKPSFITDWFDDINQYFNLFTINKKEAKTRLFNKFLTYAQDPSFRASNWLWTTKNSPGIFNIPSTNDLTKLSENNLNIEFLENFKFTKADGLKNINKRKGAGYDLQSAQDWDISNIFKFLTYRVSKFAVYPMLIQSDSGNMWNVTSNRISIYENGKPVVNNKNEIDVNSSLYQALVNTINQELIRMKQATELLFDIDEKSQKLNVKKDLDYTKLQTKYHYQKLDKDGIPILIDSNGKPTGKVFQFHNMTFIDNNGQLISLNDTEVLTNGLYRAELHGEKTNSIIANHISNFVKSQSILGKSKYRKYKNVLLNSTISDSKLLGAYSEVEGVSAFDSFIVEFMLNTYITYVEHGNFFNGTLSEYKNNKDTNKRAKQETSPRQIGSTEFRGKTYKGITFKDIELTSSFYNDMVDSVANQLTKQKNYQNLKYDKNKLKKINQNIETLNDLEKDIYFITNSYLNINRADAQSYATVDRYKKIMQDYGRWNSTFEKAFIKIKAGKDLNKEELKGFLQVLKPFYYDRVFDSYSGKMKSRQIKNSILPLIPQLVKGTQMEKILIAIEKEGIEEIYFESATKVGMGYVNSITDSLGNLKEGFSENLVSEFYLNEFWGLQLDVPSHLKDEYNKLGVQISKILLANLSKDSIYTVNNTFFTGKELETFYFKLLSTNIEESAKTLLQRLGAVYENGNWKIDNFDNIQEILVKELKERGLSKNYIEALNFVEDKITGEKVFNLPLFVSNMSTKFESILTSLFTNNITNQKFPGGHVTLASDALITQYDKIESGDISAIGINFLDSVKDRVIDGTFRLNPPIIKDGKILEAEALLPAWSKKFFKADGTRIDINELPEELLTMIGYRIPTEANYSVPVIKIVGFLPEGHDSTIILPYELVTQTGWDFDVDSLYLMQRSFKGNIEVGFEVIKYNENIELKDVDNYHIALMSNNLKEYVTLNEDIKATIIKIENSWKNQSGRLNTLIKKESNLLNTTIEDIFELKNNLIDYINYQKESLEELELLELSYTDEDINKLFESLFGISDTYESSTEVIKKIKNEIKQAEESLEIYKELLNDPDIKVRLSKRKERANKLKNELTSKIELRNNTIKNWATSLDKTMLNSKAARNNAIFDIYISILTNTNHYIENINPGKFTDPLNLKLRQEFLTGIKVDEINPNTRDGQDFFRNTNIAGRALKGLAANANSLLPILQSINAEFAVPFKIKINEEIKSFSIIANNEQGTYTNMNGDIITDHAAQMLAMILDIVKEGLPYNINTYTFDTFIAMVAAGIDIEYAGMFIRQPIINKLAEFKLNSDGILNNKSTRPIENIRRDYQTRLYKLLVLEGKISEQDAINRGLGINTEIGFRFLKDKFLWTTYNNKDKYKDTNSVLGFNAQEEKAWSLFELEKGIAASNLNNTKEIKKEGYAGWKDLSNLDKIEYFKNQLQILETFVKYKKNGDAFSAIGQVLNTDKLGTGPSLTVTETWKEKYEIAKGVNPFTGAVESPRIIANGKPAVDLVFIEDKYSPLNSYKKWANELSYNLLSPLFIEYSPGVKLLKSRIYSELGRNTIERNKVINTFIKQLLNSKLSYFNNLDSARVLGINSNINLNLDITKASNIEEFKKLSTGNKLQLIKLQLANLYNNDRTHILNLLKPKLDEYSLNKFELHRIDFKKPNSSDNIDDLVIDSFDYMFDSDNVFIKDLANDLLNYNYLTTNLTFGKNSFSNYIPTRIMTSSEYLNLRNELTLWKNLMQTESTILITGNNKNLVDIFMQNNWNNDIIVPKVKSKYLRDTSGKIVTREENGDTYKVTIDRTPDWSSYNDKSILSISYQELQRESNEVRNSTYLLNSKIVEGELKTTLFKRYYTEEDIENTNKNRIIYYYPVSKLSGASIGKEFNETSIIDSNNVPYSKEIYEDYLEHLINGNFISLSTLVQQRKAKDDNNIINCK